MTRSVSVVLLVLGLATACERGGDPEPVARNLVLVCIDAVRLDSFRQSMHPESVDPRAPWVPRALRFGTVLAPAPWSVPSLASVLTGRDPLAHGAGAFASPVANSDEQVAAGIAPGVPTLAERLRDVGWETVAFVSWPEFGSRYGLERGFGSLSVEPERRKLAGGASKWISWRTARADAPPFFLYLHFTESKEHRAWSFEERRLREHFLGATSAERALAEAPAGVCDERDSESCSDYLAYVYSIGEQVASLAEVLGTLEDSGQLDDTIVVLFSDHGDEFGDHGEIGPGRSLYQEQLHVPLWIWHPRLEGRQVLGPVSLLDIAPTALDWLGLDDAGPFDGRSLAPWLAGSGPPPEVGRPLFATRVAYGPEQFSVVRLPWKRIWRASGDAQLFHLPDDQHERVPRDEPRIAAELDALIAGWRGRPAGPTHD